MSARFVIETGTDDYGDPFGSIVRDTKTGAEMGGDGGEPEDQLLTRDWRWVPEALNKLEAEHRAEVEELLARLRRAEAEARTLRNLGVTQAEEIEGLHRAEAVAEALYAKRAYDNRCAAASTSPGDGLDARHCLDDACEAYAASRKPLPLTEAELEWARKNL